MLPPPAPKKRSRARTVGIAAGVAFLVIVGFVVGVTVLSNLSQNAAQERERTSPQPAISMSDLQGFRQLRSCVILIPPQHFIFEFSLRNTGDANGIATVTFSIDGNARDSANYYVFVGETASHSFTLSVSDCSDHSLGASVTRVVKA